MKGSLLILSSLVLVQGTLIAAAPNCSFHQNKVSVFCLGSYQPKSQTRAASLLCSVRQQAVTSSGSEPGCHALRRRAGRTYVRACVFVHASMEPCLEPQSQRQLRDFRGPARQWTGVAAAPVSEAAWFLVERQILPVVRLHWCLKVP